MSIAFDLLQTGPANVPSQALLQRAAQFIVPLSDAPLFEEETTYVETSSELPELGLDVYVDDWLFDEAAGTLSISFTRETTNYDAPGFGRLVFYGVKDYAYEWVDDSDLEDAGGWKELLPESFVDLVTPDQGTDGRYYLLTNTREVSFKAEKSPTWRYLH